MPARRGPRLRDIRWKSSTMLQWLIGDCCELLGVTVQNWALVFAGIFAGYIIALLIARARRLPL
jgi:hypothetical protein